MAMLSISAKSKYGLTAMYELGVRRNGGPVQIKHIASSHNIPQNYLEQLLVDLKKAGLVRSYRGHQGGYALAKEPSLVRIRDILACLDGPLSLSQAEPSNDVLNFFWKNVEVQIESIFDLTLGDLISDTQRREKIITYNI
jgi:Rrf2 family cysteine metabolism transcriptional repressor